MPSGVPKLKATVTIIVGAIIAIIGFMVDLPG